MARHTQIMAFCVFYIASFFVLLSLTPLGTFPPPDLTFYFGGVGGLGLGAMALSIPWTFIFAFVLFTCLGIVITINLIGNVKVLGSGIEIDAKYLSTIIVGTILSAFFGFTMMSMFPPDVPLLITIFLVWIPIFLLIYSLYMGAGMRGQD